MDEGILNQMCAVNLPRGKKDNLKTYNEMTIPLFIAVTGHRNIANDSKNQVCERVREYLQKLKERYANTDIILMSCLAEGADRIVAKIALKEGMYVAPVLPMDIDSYIKSFDGTGYDFDIKESEGDFIGILQNDNVLSPCILDGNPSDPERSYRRAGAYLVANSHVLLALWNGVCERKPGGTYDVMCMAHDGIDADYYGQSCPIPLKEGERNPVARHHLSLMEDDLIYIIGTPRESDEGKSILGVSGYVLPKSIEENNDGELSSFGSNGDGIRCESKVPDAYVSMFESIDSLNADILNGISNSVFNAHAINMEDVDDDLNDISGNPEDNGYMMEMLNRFRIVDHLSEFHRNRNAKDNRQLSLIVIVSGFALSMLMFSENGLLIPAIYVGLLVSSSYLLWSHRSKGAHQKYIEYRSVAELMRTQYHWGVSGINESVRTPCYGYMKGEMIWIRAAMLSWTSCFCNDYPTVQADPDRCLGSSACSWIRGQKAYYEGKIKANGPRIRHYSSVLSKLAIISMILSGAVLVMSSLLGSNSPLLFNIPYVVIGPITIIAEMPFTVDNAAEVLVAVSAAATAYFSYRSKAVFGGTEGQLASKKDMFDLAYDKFRLALKEEASVCNETIRGIMVELGIYSISEVSDWVYEHRNKDFKIKEMEDLMD